MTGGAGSEKTRKTSKTLQDQARKMQSLQEQNLQDAEVWTSEAPAVSKEPETPKKQEFDSQKSLDKRSRRKARIKRVAKAT